MFNDMILFDTNQKGFLMKVFSLVTLCAGFFFIRGQEAEAQLSHCPSKCYPLNSEEAANILQNAQSPLHDGQFKWSVDKVGLGFICLNYCADGELEVSPGVFKSGKCTYTITNTAEADMIGRTTEISLKRMPDENSTQPLCH